MKLRGAVLLGVLGLLTASSHGQFVRNVVLLDLGGQLVPDMEFDHVGYQVTWQDDEEQLWVAPVDEETGDFQMDRAERLDTSLAPRGPVASGQASGNGPEWVYTDEGSQILYTLQVGGAARPSNWRVGRAQKIAGAWTFGKLNDPQGVVGSAPDGTKVPEGDTNPFFLYYDLRNLKLGWGPLDTPSAHELARFQFTSPAHWVDGEHLIVGSVRFSGTDQIVLFDPARPRRIAQMTFDRRFHKIKPQMWHAPEYGSELVFFALERQRNASSFTQLGVYRLINGEWTKIKTIIPPSNPRLIDSPEAFVHNGKSYISFMALPGGSPTQGTEIWIAGIEEQDFYRKVADPSDGLPHGAPLQSTDPEYLITGSGVFIYLSQEDGSKVYRASTGL